MCMSRLTIYEGFQHLKVLNFDLERDKPGLFTTAFQQKEREKLKICICAFVLLFSKKAYAAKVTRHIQLFA